jgi:hypothetical protein
MDCNELTKENIEKILIALEDRGILRSSYDVACANCVYQWNCDEHVRCTDGIAEFLYREFSASKENLKPCKCGGKAMYLPQRMPEYTRIECVRCGRYVCGRESEEKCKEAWNRGE